MEMDYDTIKIEGLCKHYNLFQIRNLSFRLKKGSITGIIGENGAGKSTVLKMIAGITRYEKGEILFNGIKRMNGECHREIGYMSDGQDIYPDIPLRKITEYVKKSFGDRWNSGKYKHYLSGVFQVDEKKKMKELSTGMRVKYFLALELAKQPKLFLLDEPTSGLDPMIREEVIQILENLCKDEGVTILFSSHITEDIEKIAERVIYLDNGAILLDDDKENIRREYVKISKDICKTLTVNQQSKIKNNSVEVRENYLLKNNPLFFNGITQIEPALLSEVLYFLKEKPNA